MYQVNKNNTVLKISDALKGFLFRAYNARRCGNVGQVLPDNKIKRHSRMSLSGIPTAFNNAQGRYPRTLRAAASGMTTNFNNIPLTPPSPSWRGGFNNPLPPRGGRCPVRADEGEQVVSLPARGEENDTRPSSPRSVGMRGIGAAHALYPALQACGMTKCVSRGFTLIELLVVVLIIAILAAVALPQYQQAVWHARTMEALTIGRYLKDAEELYYLEHGQYTDNFENLDLPAIPCKLSSSKKSLSCNAFYFTLLTNYARVLCRTNTSIDMAISLSLDQEPNIKTSSCTAYEGDKYKAAPLCKRLTSDMSDGQPGCNGICRNWLWK